MKRILFLTLFIAVFFSFSSGQGHGSCNRAAIVDTSVYGPIYADGIPNPLLAMQHTDGTYFEKPHSVVWFCIDIPYDTILTFDLVPQRPADDLDFLLFKDQTVDKNCAMCRTEKKTFCQQMALQKMAPVRTNIARCDSSLKGMTGLSATAQNEMESPGKHSAYSKAVMVKKGERYYLAVDNYTRARGPFTLITHLRFTQGPIQEKANPIIEKAPHNVPLSNNKSFIVTVTDSATKKSVNAKIKITWIMPKGRPRIEITASQYSLAIKQEEKINIVCAAKGYLLSQSDYTAKTDSDKGINISLFPIKEHQKMVFKIEFEPGLAKFLASSDEPLNNLLQFMNDNPDINVLIKGYVNDPYSMYDAAFDLDLSQQRAKAVYQYLILSGIKSHRIQWKGYGNKEMVYPNPANEEEMQANRRVEVEIVK